MPVEVYRVQDVAAKYGVSDKQVRSWIDRGLVAFRISKTKNAPYFITHDDLMAWFEAQKKTALQK